MRRVKCNLGRTSCIFNQNLLIIQYVLFSFVIVNVLICVISAVFTDGLERSDNICVGCWPCRVAVREINLLLTEHRFDTNMYIIMSKAERALGYSSRGTPAPTSSVLQKVKK